MVNDLIRHLALDCGDKLKESFPEVGYRMTPCDDPNFNAFRSEARHCAIARLRMWRGGEPWLLAIFFLEDHAITCDRRTAIKREVPYRDPRFMDILLFELERQIAIEKRELDEH